MKLNELATNIGQGISKMGFAMKEHSPEILIVAGVVGVVTGTIMACKATTKAGEVVKEHKKEMDEVHEAGEKGVTKAGKEYSKEDLKKDTTIVYAHTAWKFVKLYGPAVLVIALSLTSIISSNQILRKRNIALGSAYYTLDQAFKEYRKRVAEKFGEEVEYNIAHNIKEEEIEETVTDEKGKEKTVKKKVNVADPNLTSPYARYFTRSNPYWEDSEDFIIFNIAQKQHYFNDKLRASGWVTLNQVYEALGFHENAAGMVVGWKYDTKNPTGDNYIEISVHKIKLPNEYTGALEDAYVLDFNVDGNIYYSVAEDPKVR